jgi:hypothetical protein
MSQGWLESDDEYSHRITQEANESIIENSSGEAPSQGWIESDDDYRSRITQEANESIIENSSGEAPSQGWIESDDDYRSRVSQKANEHIIEDSSGEAPLQGWIESDDDYRSRLRQEAHERVIEDSTGSEPSPGWLEGPGEYRRRMTLEAREITADGARFAKQNKPNDFNQNDEPSTESSQVSESHSSRSFGGYLGIVVVIAVVIFVLVRATNQTRPSPSRWDWSSGKLSLQGFGPIRIGMTLAQAQSITGGALVGQDSGNQECFYVTPSAAPEGIKLMVTEGRIARIDITSPAYASMRGARVGQMQDKVTRLYLGQLEISQHKYDDNGFYLTFIPKDLADQRYRMEFETDGMRITRFRAGKLPEVQYVEGCS